MPKHRFTYQWINSLNESGTYYDEVERGLMLRVTKTGKKSFSYRYSFNSRKKRFTIGRFPHISLSEARKNLREIKGKIAKGIDPQAEINKRKNNQQKTFKELADQFKQKHLPTLRQATQYNYKRIIDNELLPKFADKPVNEIEKNEIIKLLDDKAYRQSSPTMANRIRARLSTMFEFGMSRELAKSNPI